MKPEQERLVTVLKDTISLLCKNSLSYDKQVVIQGLICVTVDKEDVLVVQVNDTLGEAIYDPCVTCGHAKATRPEASTSTPSERRKRRRSQDSGNSPENTPAKTSRSSRCSAAEQEEREEHPPEPSQDDSRDLPSGVHIKKEEGGGEDDDEDLIMIDAEIKGEDYSVSGDYGDNDSSFNLSSTATTDTPYITGIMDNSQISGITAAQTSSSSQGQVLAGASWSGVQGDMATMQGPPGISVGTLKLCHIHYNAYTPHVALNSVCQAQ